MKVPFKVGAVGHFGLAVRNPKKSARWFQRALGLRKEFEFDSGIAVGNDNITMNWSIKIPATVSGADGLRKFRRDSPVAIHLRTESLRATV